MAKFSAVEKLQAVAIGVSHKAIQKWVKQFEHNGVKPGILSNISMDEIEKPTLVILMMSGKKYKFMRMMK